MNLTHLRYFIKLAEIEHYSHAAQDLNISQPTLTYAINQIEDELGLRLFEKSGRNISLTHIGLDFYHKVKDNIDQFDEIIMDMKLQSMGSGLIRVGTIRVLSQKIVPNAAQKFKQLHEHVDINFIFSTGNGLSTGLIDGLKNKRYDLVFCSKTEDNPEITYVPLSQQEMILLVPRNHALAKFDHITLDKTLAYPHIRFKHSSGIRTIVDKIYASQHVNPTFSHELEEDDSIAGMVGAGFGIALLPRLPINQLLDVKEIQIDNLQYGQVFYMAYLNSIYHSPVIQNFIDFVAERYSIQA
ncbi:LysR family transcriptional regulator [Eremococcus coleocola]|uniref:LysR family transcriptional regulator n=1 Tax=Eremococcus coleocola TaxID=88132 RepID=UPI0004184884|nr:LysR family transcriptional regulator [Eremococcus coleocola]